MLAQSCSAVGAGVVNSTVEHLKAAMGFLFRVRFGMEMEIGYSCCTVMSQICMMESIWIKGVVGSDVCECERVLEISCKHQGGCGG